MYENRLHLTFFLEYSVKTLNILVQKKWAVLLSRTLHLMYFDMLNPIVFSSNIIGLFAPFDTRWFHINMNFRILKCSFRSWRILESVKKVPLGNLPPRVAHCLSFRRSENCGKLDC